ncbi:MAG: DUF697 domain-containing protein [Saprospiraceae bacterium]|nr:DUF697 domain-containing protein [Saprospiraceae bacterium]
MSISSPEEHAETIIRNHVVMSMGAGIIPIMLVDIVAVTALQVDMVRQLCKVYDVDFEETRGKALITSITASTIARAGARSLVKALPGIGWMIGGVAVSLFAGASTYGLGKAFQKHLAAGGNLFNIDTSALKQSYRDLFEKGKEIVVDWKQKEEHDSDGGSADPVPPSDLSDRLRELASWKEQGILTDDEFQRLKKALLEQLPV